MNILKPGDEVFYLATDGRKFRGLVADYLFMRSDDARVPVIKSTGRIVHWIHRKQLRKAPTRKVLV